MKAAVHSMSEVHFAIKRFKEIPCVNCSAKAGEHHFLLWDPELPVN